MVKELTRELERSAEPAGPHDVECPRLAPPDLANLVPSHEKRRTSLAVLLTGQPLEFLCLSPLPLLFAPRSPI